MHNEEILEQNGGKKFDIILSNPPYANGLHEKFLLKYLDIANIIVSIQPISYLFKGKQGNVNIKNSLLNGYVNIKEIDANRYFKDAHFQNKIGILYCNYLKHSKEIIINNRKINDIFNIKPYFDDSLIVEFSNIVEPLIKENNGGNKWFGTPGSHYSDRIIDTEDENPNIWCVQCVLIRGNVSPNQNDGKADNFYTLIPKNEQLINSQFIGLYKDLILLKNNKNKLKLQYYYRFNSKQEAYNFINYQRSDFCRACLYLKKLDMNTRPQCIPWFDFSDPIFSKSPREIDDYLFKKYKISSEIRKHIEEILPDYYGIRN